MRGVDGASVSAIHFFNLLTNVMKRVYLLIKCLHEDQHFVIRVVVRNRFVIEEFVEDAAQCIDFINVALACDVLILLNLLQKIGLAEAGQTTG